MWWLESLGGEAIEIFKVLLLLIVVHGDQKLDSVRQSKGTQHSLVKPVGANQ